MRLFRPSNKSQASLDKHIDSRDENPAQNEASHPHVQTHNEAQYQGPPPQQHREPGDERYYRPQTQSPTNPPPVLDRSQSGRVPPSAVDAYAKDPLHQPTVNVVPPQTPNTPTHQTHFISNQEITLQSPSSRVDPDKKSKRGFFGFGSRKDDKDSAGDRNRVHRTSSVLKKANHQQPQVPQVRNSPQERQASQQFPEAGDQGYPQELKNENQAADPEHYEQYYRAQERFESDNNPGANQPVRYLEDAPNFEQQQPPTPRHNKQPSLQSQQSQRAGYPLYHQTSSANNSSTYLQQQPQNAAINHPLRPPSPASFGPPSPLVTGNNNPDSRPPTADPQGRLPPYPITQSISQRDLLHQRQVSQDIARTEDRDTMGRSEGSNGNTRQQREDDRHLHYPNQQDPRIRTQSHDQGRNTPPPRNREDLASLDYQQLLARHEELLQKYSKVKRYYFEREAQVTQLQNTVANQRLSMSKTTLDDAQYATRFERLNGAIQNLAFNIRKDWRRVPNWLTPVCNRDACQVGMKEMTAIGRACITRWLFEYVFERVFHPGLEPNFSLHLKSVERNLRHAHYGPFLTNEQQDDLMIKIMTWRLTTVEGLQDVLHSKNASDYQETLENSLTRQLNDYLGAFLIDPPPRGMLDSLYGIIHQTVGICQNIPLESRDIQIVYPMPASHINEIYMKIETNMTPLQSPGSAPSPSDQVHSMHGDDDETSTSSSVVDHPAQSQADIEAQIRVATDAGMAPNPAAGPPPRGDSMPTANKMQDKASSGKKTGSLFGGLVNRRPAPSESSSAGTGLTLQNSDSSRSGGEPAADAYNLHSLTNGMTEGKIRFAVFLAVDVRGRSVLAPKENDKSKDGDKASMHGSESAGTGQQPADGGNGSTGSKSDKALNVLAKAPVYVFE